MSQGSSAFRADIEGLRAIAVLLVILYHAGLPLTGGYVGVDVFFVISGFLITGLLLREAEKGGGISLLNFYARRARRLLPAATTVLVLTIPLVLWLAPQSERHVFALDVVAAAAYVVNWRFAERSVDYLAEDVGRSPSLHFWSLSVEEQFYFLWPLLIILGATLARKARWSLRPTVAVSLCLVLAPSLFWSIVFTKGSPTEAFFVTTTRLWELAIGALLALGLPYLSKLPERLGPLLSLIGLGLIAGSSVLYDDKVAWPGAWALAPTLGTAVTILGGSLGQNGVLLRTLSSRPMVWIGRLSYSIYLWHWPLVVVGQDWLRLKGPVWGSVLVSVSILPAWLSYRFVERPVRFAPALAQSRLATLSLGANLSLLAVVAGLAAAMSAAPASAETQAASVELAVTPGTVRANPRDLGAGALGDKPRAAKAGRSRDSYATMSPAPSRATKDVPRAYPEGCQAKFPDVEPKWCKIGDPTASRRAVVLGDSKILQYFEVLDAIGKAGGWHISTATKSSCPSSNAIKHNRGAPYETCKTFNDIVMSQLEQDRPDVVITSQGASGGYLPGQKPKSTRAGMIAGLVSRWTRFRELGVGVVVVLDNPHPKPKTRVYECMERYPNNAKRCAFSRQQGISRSAAGVLRAAAEQVPGTQIVDVTDYICPRERCAPVIGDILVYRQGAHITNTYAKTLAPILSERMLAAMDAATR